MSSAIDEKEESEQVNSESYIPTMNEEIECEVISDDEDDQTARSSTINITEGERLY